MAFKSPPAKVHSYVTKLLKANLIKTPPVWYPAASLAPPSPTFVREGDVSGANRQAELPFETEERLQKEKAEAAGTSYTPRGNSASAPSSSIVPRSARTNKHLRWKSLRPKNLYYPEDRLRRRFYEDHPWELRRPRCLIETTGDGTRRDWSKLLQEGRSISDLTGEDVIQYQMYLMSTGKSEREAYHIATEEFYKHRAQEESEARVAKAQAMAFGLRPRRSFVMNGLKREEEALREAEKSASRF
ncbi:mitochondrial ribosomal small subunit component [Lobosporangium transversale]|uniref:Small ribosomal subunit protein mS23 n=1 Tax=Lobosporangium transversale TaxID=64571 RepID=A0A1Y2GBD6_9FUNG|nr:mitochondrial ribosomal protein S25 [Lobosporangium transversale]KAF9917974.1 mitochondrial ribosomal small subunit component [Lobosporangium transversale]ORZ06284.1 mitochondrial ribosomal protein S25 [Lobosporangium transversale]|eukprot:XP_021877447.1 mitochondrial ribosomal protein S25 [Lobosporangium transversale]